MIHPKTYKVILSSVELRQLINAYGIYVIPTVEPEDFTGRLLWQIMLELYILFRSKASTLRKRNSIPFTGSQTMAFMAYWSLIEVHHPYEDLVIRNIIASLDQSQKSYAATANAHLQS